MDPDKASQMVEYSLDSFKNSIWENFMGSQVQLSKTIEENGVEKITNRNVERMGPV
jgi:hypothetical protein